MAKKILEASLDANSIGKLIKNLEFFNKYTDEKLYQLVSRLRNIGANVVKAKLQEATSDDLSPDLCSVSFVFDTKTGHKVEGRLIITSEPIFSNRRSNTGLEFDSGEKDEQGNPIMKKGSATTIRVFWPHLAYEFGAGNAYNGMRVNNPYASEFGMGPGTFPEQTHVPDPGWWTMSDFPGNPSRDPLTGATQYKGTQATMPMYNAWLEMSKNLAKIAREVFDG